MITNAYAADAATGGAIFEFLFPLVMVFAIIYFMIIRPQQRRQKAHNEMIDAVQRGDKVITQGGLVGKVAKVGEDEIEIDVNDTRLTIVKSMLASVVSKKD